MTTDNQTRDSAGSVAVAILILAMTLLALQLVATRLFSVIIWNHFAFLAISVALFGFGVAGIAVFLLPAVFTRERALNQIRICSLSLPFLIWGVVAVLCSLPIRMDFTTEMFAYLGVIFFVTSLPFAVGGLAITIALTHWAEHVNRIYAYDLVGSSLGCLLVIGTLSVLDGPSAAMALGTMPILAALRIKRSAVVAALGVALLLGSLVNSSLGFVRVKIARSRIQTPIYEEWNAFSRVTVSLTTGWRGWWVGPASPEPRVPALAIQIDADALTPLIKFDGDFEKVAVLLADITSAAYYVAPNADSVLVIGAGGGKDVLAALASGARHVRAVELNPLIADRVVSGRYAEYGGNLYSRPDVELTIGEGRTVLRHDTEQYDIVQISMVDTSAASAAGAYALTENSLYTLEAAQEFLQHLKPEGVMTATWANWANVRGGVRLVSQFSEALRLANATPVAERIVVIGSGSQKYGMICPGVASCLYTVLVRPSGFSADDISMLREMILRRGLLPVYLPGDPLHGGRLGSDLAAVRRLISGEKLDEFYDEFPLDVSPVYDDRPFFFYQNRLRDAAPALVNWEEGSMYGNGMLIIVKLIVISTVAVTLFMGLPLLIGRRRQLGELRSSGSYVVYFACLGVGFIVLEIALLQMFGYYLGHPLLGLGVSLASLLLFTGLGSALGSRWSDELLPSRLNLALLSVIGLSSLYFLLLPVLTDATIGWHVLGRCLVVAATLAPLGTLLGLPFPSGVRMLRDRNQLIPWMWAINAGATVLGASLATLIVMHLGFSRTLLVGAAIYALALFAIRRAAAVARSA